MTSSSRPQTAGALRRFLLLGLLGAGVLAACTTTEDTDLEEVGSEDALVTADGKVILPQGWNDADRDAWAHMSDGSGLFPFPWYMALELPTSETLFSSEENMKAFGFLPSPKSATNPFGLPVGLAVQKRPRGPMPMIGSNCAACHQAEITYEGKTILVQGGQGAASLQGFAGAAFRALGATLATLQSPDRSKFERFATRVFTITGQAQTFTGPDAEQKKQAATQQLIAGIQQALAKVQASAAFDAAHQISSEGWGPYRNDAVESGGNIIASKVKLENRARIDAPVSMPYLWDTSTFDWVEYNGSFRQPTGRNVISTLARNADLGLDPDPTKGSFENSVELDNVVAFEKLVRKLRSPKWPADILGRLDTRKVARGKKLYAAKCATCHDPGKDADGRLAIVLVPLDEIGTDRAQAEHMVERRFDFNGFQNTSREMTLAEMSKFVTDGVIAKNRTPSLEAAMAETDGNRTNDFRAPLAYRARPLNGIWATAPYLHNGSVPNLYELLLPEEKRSAKFFTGNREIDPKRVGLVATSGPFELVTGKSAPTGNKNTGHSGPRYGTDLGDDDRYALIEYLKSL